MSRWFYCSHDSIRWRDSAHNYWETGTTEGKVSSLPKHALCWFACWCSRNNLLIFYWFHYSQEERFLIESAPHWNEPALGRVAWTASERHRLATGQWKSVTAALPPLRSTFWSCKTTRLLTTALISANLACPLNSHKLDVQYKIQTQYTVNVYLPHSRSSC